MLFKLTGAIYINKRKFCACVCVCSRHYGLPMARRALNFFCGCISQGPCALGRELLISLLDFFLKIQNCDFLRFFHFELNFLYFNFHSDLDFLPVCAKDISASNKKKIEK